MFQKPAPRIAKNRKTMPIEGTARPMFDTEMARNAARPVWPSQTPSGSATRMASAIAVNVS